MSSRAIASTSRAFVSAAAFLILLLAGAARGGEERPLEAALKAAARDGKPVLVLVRRDWDVASLDAGHWLDEPTGFKERLARFHAVKVWSGEKDLAPFAGAPQDGFLFLTPKGETIAVSEVPLLKAKMADLLDGILKWPLPYAALRDAVKADPADAARRAHALAVLEQMGRSDEAAALLAPLAGKEPALAARLEELAAEAPAHQAARAARLVQLLEKLAQAKRADAPPASALEPALREFVSLSGSWPEPARKALAAAHEAAVKYAAAPDTDEAFAAVQQAAAPLPAVLRAAMQALGQEAQKRNAALAQARPADLKVQLAALRSLLRGGERDAKNDAPLKELLDKLIAREMSLEELLRATGLVAYAALLLEQDEACRAWAARLTREAPLGRNVADTFLDLADWAFAAGAEKEADEYYREAEKASSAGESVTLYRAARAMRDAADGRNGPNRSKWAKRTIRDVLVLVPDMDAYANALAAWSDGEFFPVLFQDDEYAPRFAAAFKPRQVLVVPPAEGRGAGDALEPDLLRRTVAAAWERDDGKVPARVGVEDLRERLARVESEPLGLVVSDGVSGETAGGLALAAGRFQGFEIVPVPEIGSGDQKRTAQPNDFLSAAQAWDLAARVLQGLNAIGLPREDRWAAVTLAGAYPYRYSGEVYERWGGTHALEDTLGRDPGDHTRLAVATRLLGDAPRSAYQAMCSLFLQPQDALLFNTYGTNPKTIWGKYRMDFSEAAWKGLLRVDHVNGKDAVIETFRARTGPWNRYGLLTINSSGGSTNWSIGGGGGTPTTSPSAAPWRFT
ncbi:MAG: thioredoxin family protein [Planctomycetota bacterium]|nr:thioredoxin family protein [Planctomycetota bacterium]